MKRSSLFLALSIASAASSVSWCCERLPVDPEFPAGLAGQYEIVGRDPITGAGYTGTLLVSHGKSAYALKRTIQGESVNGDAWVERCGIDRILGFVARYHTDPVTEIGCSMSGDGDNYNRLTCRTRQGGKTWQGLEAWFQDH